MKIHFAVFFFFLFVFFSSSYFLVYISRGENGITIFQRHDELTHSVRENISVTCKILYNFHRLFFFVFILLCHIVNVGVESEIGFTSIAKKFKSDFIFERANRHPK